MLVLGVTITRIRKGVDDDVKTRLTYSSREESGVDDVLKVVEKTGRGSGGTCTR